MSALDQIYQRLKDDLENNNEKFEKSEIQNFFTDKTILITGATGFLGKCLVEKLLRSCYDLKNIYILVRRKKDLTVEEILKKYFQNEVRIYKIIYCFAKYSLKIIILDFKSSNKKLSLQ